MLPPITHAEALAGADSTAVLRALLAAQEAGGVSLAALEAAGQELDDAGDLGLTISIDEVLLRANPEGLWGRLGAASELYVVTTVLDASLRPFEYQTAVFPGSRPGQLLPLGDGGLLVGCLTNPRWFIDIHMLVMESDAGADRLAGRIEEAKRQAQLDAILEAAGHTAQFDPGVVAQLVNGVDLFLGALTTLLQANGDDHVATVHDFYLKHQAFGKGRHPAEGRKRFQGIDVAYEIQLTRLATVPDGDAALTEAG